MKFVHETKTKHNMDKITLKDDTNAIISHCHICDQPMQFMSIMHIHLLGNTPPLKGDRKLEP